MTADVVVFGKHVDVSADLRTHTVEKLRRLDKFAGDVRRIDVDFSEHATRRAADSHRCEILVHVNRHLVKGQAAAVDHRSALDLALDKVEQQLRRLHDRRTRKAPRKGRASANGSAAPEEEGEDHGPAIVKAKHFEVKPMAPDEAALQMELLGHDFYVFTSTETGRAAVLYRRRDGNLGLIETLG